MSSIHIIYASTSGHTEYVVEVLSAFFESKNIDFIEQRIEEVQVSDLSRGDVLIFASGTWNTGGVEGQLNPLMHEFFTAHDKDIDLKNKRCGIIALGDDRYFYTGRSGEHIRKFILSHNGSVIEPPLMVINEPYGQEAKILKWGEKFLSKLS